MTRPEEQHARDLHRTLSRVLAADARTRLTVEGAGVHWMCAATRGDRACSTSCFANLGPEYLTQFTSGGDTEAWGRTPSRDDTTAAVARWLGGAEVSDLHAAFPFVDRDKRALLGLADAVTQSHPR